VPSSQISRCRESAYQDSVTAPTDREHDDDAVLLDETEDDNDKFGALEEVLSAVDKVSK
jgi:hypothetical protein